MPLILVLVVALFGWGAVRAMTRGVNVSILGARGSGKTTLVRQLRGEGYDPNQPATSVDEVYRKVVFWRGPIRVVLHHVPDLRGGYAGHDVWGEWRRSAADRDVILYLVDARMLFSRAEGMADDYARDRWQRAVRDADQMRLWREEDRKANARKADQVLYFVVVTHRDQDPRASVLSRAEYDDLMATQLTEIVTRLGPDRTQVMSANLTSEEDVKTMVKNVAVQYRRRRRR